MEAHPQEKFHVKIRPGVSSNLLSGYMDSVFSHSVVYGLLQHVGSQKGGLFHMDPYRPG